MAEEKDQNDGEKGEEEGEASEGGGNKKLIIIIAVVLLLLVGGAAGAYFMGLLDPLLGGDETPEESEEIAEKYTGDPVFFELEEILVNLNASGGKTVFLKLKLSLELEKPSDKEKIQKTLPKVIDGFQIYLRELRVDDLEGAAGLYRLREELMRRLTSTTAPLVIKNVLFREMLIQ